MWKSVSKYIAFSILLTGILCISGCGNSAVEAESEISIIEAEITEKATDVAEDNPSEITAGENRLEESMEESASKSENKEEHSMGEASKGYMDVPSGDEEGSQGREQTAGQLSVEGTKLVDAAGNPVQLRGISTHGLAWYPSYVNEACFRQLKEEWGANVIRLAMYTAENGGYCTDGDREELKALIKGGVEYAANNDMYVIVDWHVLSDGNPNQYLEESLAFFGEMSEAYAGYTNVLYEICNEPNGNVSWGEIKSYAEQVIEVIRGNDKEGVILVGTPNWSQYVDQAAADPIQGYDNIMYTLHFYAATHTDSLRDTMVKAVESGLPVFVSEYGICDASGNGAINAEQADRWIEVMDSHNISYVAWNLSNKAETSAILKSNCEKTESFSVEDLSDSGKWLYGMLREGRDAASVGENSMGREGIGTEGQATRAGEEAMEAEEGEMPAGGIANGGQNFEGAEGRQVSVDLEVTATIVNSWEQDNKSYYQYSLTITNLTEEDIKGWTVQLEFSGDIALQDTWNGSYQAEHNALTISSLEYNGDISEGSSVENVGFIVQGETGLTVVR